MAASQFKSEQYFPSSFVESAGAVLFRLSTQKICILHLHSTDEYTLPKGRRNLGESRKSTAMREVNEETGYSCRILPLTMSTRNPPAVETEPVPDEARVHHDAEESFALQIRHLGMGEAKLTWWYVAAVNEEEKFDAGVQERDRFGVDFYGYDDALETLTFEMDRDMVEKAIGLVESTYSHANSST